MKKIEFPCEYCGQIMNMGMVQQVFALDGRYTSFHVGCFEAWFDKEIDVMRVCVDGSCYVTREPVSLEGETEASIEWTKMAQGKYHSLKEFQGF